MKKTKFENFANKFLNPIEKTVNKCNQKKIDVIILMCFFFLSCIALIYSSVFFKFRYLFLYIPSCTLLGIVIILGVKESFFIKKVHPIVFICWIIITLSIAINGFIYNHDELSELVIWLIILPLFYFVWNGQEERLFPLLAKGISLSFIPYIFSSIILVPITGGRYAGILSNTNVAAMFLTVIIICTTFLLFNKCKTITAILYSIEIGAAGILLFYTSSRGGMYASAFAILALLIILFIKKYNWRVIILKITGIIASIFIFSQLLIPISLGYHNLISKITHNPISNHLSIAEIQDEIKNTSIDRFNNKPSNLNEYSTGRVDLWTIYAKELNILGHKATDVVYRNDGTIEGRSSHFTQLQFAYNYGIFAGISLLVIHIFSSLASITYAFKQKMYFSVFPFIVTIGYGLYSVIEANVTTFGRIIIILYYISIIPLLNRKTNK